MRVVFWGTPEFAVPALRALVGEGHDVVGVVTQPDKPVGRSRTTLVPPPVKQAAVEEWIPVLQPERPRGDEFMEQLRVLEPDVSVVVAYGHILPEDVVNVPRLGTLNIHASLLPELRGAAPIQRAILRGFDETGVTIMKMVREMDAGPIILQERTPVVDDDTAGELALRLSELGALALIEAMVALANGKARERPQDESKATYAPKIERDEARIDWSRGPIAASRAIRAFDPKPGAWTTLNDVEVKLYGARLAPDHAGDPGVVLAIGEMGMLVACGQQGAVRVAYVHPAGRRRLAALDWHQGRGVRVGDRLV